MRTFLILAAAMTACGALLGFVSHNDKSPSPPALPEAPPVRPVRLQTTIAADVAGQLAQGRPCVRLGIVHALRGEMMPCGCFEPMYGGVDRVVATATVAHQFCEWIGGEGNGP